MKKTDRQTSLFTINSSPETMDQTTKQPASIPSVPQEASKIKSHARNNNLNTTHADAHDRADSLDKIYARLVDGVKKFFAKNHYKRAVLGLSGGVDSALTLKIAIDALGSENVTALILPELGLTKQENIDHAKALCEFLGVPHHFQPINPFLSDFAITPWDPGDVATMNTKARVRAVLLYSFANTEYALVLGTSNKSEILLGYGTKFGDLAADLEVIGDLYKTEVIKLADHIGLPLEIVNKTPSAELSPGQTDEAELGANYNDLDKVLMKRDLGQNGCVEHGLPMALVNLVFRRMEENKHKSEQPYVISAS